MNYNFIKYEPSKEKEWDDFVVNNSINGTIFYTQKFLSYHTNNKFEDSSLMIYDNDILISVILLAKTKDGYFSHPGTSGGGFVFYSKIIDSEIEEIVNNTNKHLDFKIFIRLPEDILTNNYSQKQNNLLSGLNKDKCIFLNCNSIQKSIEFCFNKRLQQGIKSYLNDSSKEIRIINSKNDLLEFYSIIKSNLEKYGDKPVHSEIEFLKLIEILKNNQLCYCTFENSKLVAGVWVVKATNNVWHTQYIAKDYKNASQYAMHSVILKTNDFAYKNEIKHLNLGSCRGGIGPTFQHGIYNFKMSLGGKETNKYL